MRRVPHMPQPGGYVEVLSEEIFLGGEAANTANALRIWGDQYLLAGNALGCDGNGETLANALAQLGLTPVTDHLRDIAHAPVCDVYVGSDGERTMIGAGFSDMEQSVSPEKLPFVPGGWFTAEPNMGDAARQALRLARSAQMKIYAMDFVREDDPTD